jgi:hypothetical protein
MHMFSTLSVECCYQNVGIATSVALTMFRGEELSTAMAVPLYYGLIEAVILGIYCIGAWKSGWTKAPKNIGFFTMISTSYEVLITEHGDLIAVEVSLPKNQKDLKEKIKMGSDGDTIHLKHSIDEEMDMVFDEKNCGLGCLSVPTKPKEPSGLSLPLPPEEGSGLHMYNFWEESASTLPQEPSGSLLSIPSVEGSGLHMYDKWEETAPTKSKEPSGLLRPLPPKEGRGFHMYNLWEDREKSPRHKCRL